MRLELEQHQVQDIEPSDVTQYRQGLLTINSGELEDLLWQDPRLADVMVELARPSESCRILQVCDVIQLPGVNFGSGSDRLLPGFEGLLKDAATTLNKYPELVIEVAGHTDDVGDASLNQGLSERRAKTVMDYLIRYGVDPSRLSFRGYGESQPIANNTTLEGRAQNRRVELRITGQ